MTKSLTPYTDKFSFSGQEDNEDMDFDALKKAMVEEITLPAFYTFDEPKSVFKIHVKHVEDKNFIITVVVPDGESVDDTTFSDLEDAYDYVSKNYSGNIQFTGDIEALTGSDDNFFVSVPSKTNPKFFRLLLGRGEDESVWLAKSKYFDFLKRSNRYVSNPNDFRTSFRWLDTHPIFWFRYSADSNDWQDNGAIGKMWIEVTADKQGNTVIMLEHGSAVEPARTTHYHDLRLDVYAPTYEKAIIELAALVHKFFDVDGSERTDVEYEKSELELMLEDKLNEVASYDSEEE